MNVIGSGAYGTVFLINPRIVEKIYWAEDTADKAERIARYIKSIRLSHQHRLCLMEQRTGKRTGIFKYCYDDDSEFLYRYQWLEFAFVLDELRQAQICHDDLHRGNLRINSRAFWLIDWDNAILGNDYEDDKCLFEYKKALEKNTGIPYDQDARTCYEMYLKWRYS
jgi:thiamine kinase-like enzyme